MSVRGFIKLLKRYGEGNLPNSVRKTLDLWYGAVYKEPIEKDEKDEIRNRIWEGIVAGKENDREYSGVKGKRVFWRRVGFWRVAASVLILGASAVYLSDKPGLRQSADYSVTISAATDWTEVVNREEKKKEVLLTDGSTVTLEPGSRLRYPRQFDEGSRTVFLEGDGFFDVTADVQRPFLVHSGAVLTRVLGTSFSIRTDTRTGGTEVAVLSGKVVVEKAKPSDKSDIRVEGENRIVLTPNKKVTFFKDSDHYVTGLVENPVLISTREQFLKPGVFDFDETPLAEVISVLEKAYGVEITLSNDDMLDCPVTADLTSENLYGKVELIGAVLSAKYEITGSSILLSGGGCGTGKSDRLN